MATPEEEAAAKAVADKKIADDAAAAKKKADEDEAERKRLSDPDHAKSVIARANAEAKVSREEKEAAQAERDAARKEADEAKAKLKAREDKDLEDQKKFQELAEKREKELADEKAARAKDREETHAALIREAIAREAVKAGIIDEDDIDLPAFKEAVASAKVESGRVVGAADAVAKMKESKPSKFKAEETADEKAAREAEEARRTRDGSGRFAQPKPGTGVALSKIDAAKLNPEEFEQLRADMRAARR